MAASSPSKDKDDKVFDVTKPGKTAASASSRPLIVGHKNMLKDPMVNEVSVSEMDEDKAVNIEKPIEDDAPSGSPPLPIGPDKPKPEEVEAMSAPSDTKAVIEPLMEAETVEEPVADNKVAVKIDTKKPSSSSSKSNDTKKSTKPVIEPIAATKTASKEKPTDPVAAEEGLAEETATTEPEPKPETTTETEPEAETEATAETADSVPDSDSKITEAGSSENDSGNATTEAQKKAEKEAQEAAAQQEKMEKLIAGKQYFVPIGEKTRKKRSLRRSLLGLLLILLLGGALAYLMADVGIIKTSYKLPYHFFKQSSTQNSTSQSKTSTTSTSPTDSVETSIAKEQHFQVEIAAPKDKNPAFENAVATGAYAVTNNMISLDVYGTYARIFIFPVGYKNPPEFSQPIEAANPAGYYPDDYAKTAASIVKADKDRLNTKVYDPNTTYIALIENKPDRIIYARLYEYTKGTDPDKIKGVELVTIVKIPAANKSRLDIVKARIKPANTNVDIALTKDDNQTDLDKMLVFITGKPSEWFMTSSDYNTYLQEIKSVNTFK